VLMEARTLPNSVLGRRGDYWTSRVDSLDISGRPSGRRSRVYRASIARVSRVYKQKWR